MPHCGDGDGVPEAIRHQVMVADTSSEMEAIWRSCEFPVKFFRLNYQGAQCTRLYLVQQRLRAFGESRITRPISFVSTSHYGDSSRELVDVCAELRKSSLQSIVFFPVLNFPLVADDVARVPKEVDVMEEFFWFSLGDFIKLHRGLE